MKTNTTRNFFAVFSNVGHSATVGYVVDLNATVITHYPLTASAYNMPYTDPTGAVSGRAMKCSATLLNTTSNNNCGGRVLMMGMAERIRLSKKPSLHTAAEWRVAISTVIGDDDCNDYKGTFFAEAKTVDCSVVDSQRYEVFHPWYGASYFVPIDGVVPVVTDAASALHHVDAFWSTIAVWPGMIENPRSMSTTIFYADFSTTEQDYHVSGAGSWYTRWAADTALNGLMSPSPTAPPSTINKIMDAATRAQSVFAQASTAARLGADFMEGGPGLALLDAASMVMSRVRGK
jgi:hypothetical protein